MTTAIKSTYDAYPMLSAFERERLFKEDRIIEKFKQQIKTAFTNGK